MDWFQAVDIYCERTSDAFWAEPVNALSNLSFILASLWGAIEARRRALPQPVLWLLIALAAVIGIGSFLFHTFANHWSELADTLPIWTFVAIYVLTSMRWIGGMKPGRVGIIALIAIGIVVAILATGEGDSTAAAPSAPDSLNGSGQYFPAVLALVAFSLLTWWRKHPYRHWVWAATLAFLISLTFRTLDRDICATFPLGTHFIWHLMNGAMIAALLQLLIRVMGNAAAAPTNDRHLA